MEKGSNAKGMLLRDVILGSQDGLVNVLGLLLGVATATGDARLVLVSGASALFAESISMGAVAFTSSKAARDFYFSELARERREIRDIPEEERNEIRDIYARKGFRGRILETIVKTITSDKKLWLNTMMTEELRMFPEQYAHPVRAGIIVFIATVVGSAVPLVPFILFPVSMGMVVSLTVSGLALFGLGVAKAKVTMGNLGRSGLEMFSIGALAAIAGFVAGEILQRVLY